MALKILQINIKSLVHNRNLIENYMETENIHIAILSEVWLPENYNIKFNKYNMYANCRTRVLGTVAFLVEKRFVAKYQSISHSGSTIEAAEIEMVNTKQKF